MDYHQSCGDSIHVCVSSNNDNGNDYDGDDDPSPTFGKTSYSRKKSSIDAVGVPSS